MLLNKISQTSLSMCVTIFNNIVLKNGLMLFIDIISRYDALTSCFAQVCFQHIVKCLANQPFCITKYILRIRWIVGLRKNHIKTA